MCFSVGDVETRPESVKGGFFVFSSFPTGRMEISVPFGIEEEATAFAKSQRDTGKALAIVLAAVEWFKP
jgi:hypothetical protein